MIFRSKNLLINVRHKRTTRMAVQWFIWMPKNKLTKQKCPCYFRSWLMKSICSCFLSTFLLSMRNTELYLREQFDTSFIETNIQRFIKECKLTLGSHTWKPKFTVSGCFSSTGWGHFHCENTRKNLWTKVAATAFGYSWHVLATNIAQETPPR